MGAESVVGTSYAGSVASSRSAASQRRARADKLGEDRDEDGGEVWDRRSTLEYGIFGVLFTLSKEKSETQIPIRWILLKVLLDAWQLFTTVISPEQGWNIDPHGTAWKIVGVLNFTWLADLGYNAYLGVLYAMLALLAVNVAMCVWVAWCFKEHKFAVVWPIQVLRVFSSVFFQAFDVASLNLLQLGISCRFTGPVKPHLHFDLFPQYSCIRPPHIMHAVVSALCLVLFVAIALLLNMAEVEVNPLSRRPNALGHSGAEVAAFAIKVLLTLVSVVFGWRKVAACAYLVLCLALAWQYLRWSPHLVAWMNYLKTGVSVSVCWCAVIQVVLVFKPGVKAPHEDKWAETMTLVMLVGLGPMFLAGALASWGFLRYSTQFALRALANSQGQPAREAYHNFSGPRDVEIAARSCRALKKPFKPELEAVNRSHALIKAGLELYPRSAYMVLLHANFMIDVLGVSQSGGRRIEEARKLNPGLMCRFVMFTRQQQATQDAASNSVDNTGAMDLLGYVEYQRKQRMVVRLHREALQAMCNFWRALDTQRVSFKSLSKALSGIESSVTQAQAAYRVVLERYGNNPKLVHLYGRFLQSIKNDPWRAAEYFAEAERLGELQDGHEGGPLMPDGTPLARMDDMDSAVLVVTASGMVQMANRVTHSVFGYKRGSLEGKALSTLLAPQFSRWLTNKLTALAEQAAPAEAGAAGTTFSGKGTADEGPQGDDDDDEDDGDAYDDVVVGLHRDRVAFPIKLTLRKASGVGEDSTIIALIEVVHKARGEATLWVAPTGIITACDPMFIATFGWKSGDVNGANVSALIALPESGHAPDGAAAGRAGQSKLRTHGSHVSVIKRLIAQSKAVSVPSDEEPLIKPLRGLVSHKFSRTPMECDVFIVRNEPQMADVNVYQLRIKLIANPSQRLVVNRKGHIMYASPDLTGWLRDVMGTGHLGGGLGGGLHGGLAAGQEDKESAAPFPVASPAADALPGYTFFDFLPPPWKDMHPKLLKEITPVSPPALCQWSCRKTTCGGDAGSVLALRTASGKEIFMRLTVETVDATPETLHVVQLVKSTLGEALAERRLRLSLSSEGQVLGIVEGDSKQLFGLEPSQVLGCKLWELVEEAPGAKLHGVEQLRAGHHMMKALIHRGRSYPGHSWRVQVGRRTAAGDTAGTAGATKQTSAVTPLSVSRPSAVMQVGANVPRDDNIVSADTEFPILMIDLWPIASITGVLQLDTDGRIRAVPEERLRPAGLLFGLPTRSLVGRRLEEFVVLPPGRASAADLLVNGAIKSSLKKSTKDKAVKVGPLHVLQGGHMDGLPLQLDVQMVGKASPDQPITAVLRFRNTPMMPYCKGQPAAAASSSAGHSCAAGPSFKARRSFTLPPKVASPRSVPVLEADLAEDKPPQGGLGPDATVSAVITRRTPTPPGKADDAVPLRGSYSSAAAGDAVTLTKPGLYTASEAAMGTDTSLAGAGSKAPQDQRRVTGEQPNEATSVATADSEIAAQPFKSSTPPNGMPVTRQASDASRTLEILDGLGPDSRLEDLVKEVEGERPISDDGKALETVLLQTEKKSSLACTAPGSGALQQDGCRPAVERLCLSPPGSLPGSPIEPFKVQSKVFDKAWQTGPVKTGTPDARPKPPNRTLSDGSGGKLPSGIGAERVREWVESKGAFYQNGVDDTAKAGAEDTEEVGIPDDLSACTSDDAGGSCGQVEAGALQPMAPGGDRRPSRGQLNPREDEGSVAEVTDAASEAGMSAAGFSGQSVLTSVEYTRGKRYKKLVQLMDSAQAQQVQRRLHLHSLITVAVLTVVHVVCFILTLTSVQSQKESMLRLAASGQLARYVCMVPTDVRSLDIISANKSIPTLFIPEDADMFAGQVASIADDIKTTFNDILDKNVQGGSHSSIEHLFFNDHVLIWDDPYSNGTERWVNVTLWDFATRFYTMAKFVQQNAETYTHSGVRFAETSPGKFLLRSGPELWANLRKVLDALLYIAVDDAERIDRLQVAFLVVEGAGISFIAACYLAYLLSAVAAQRYKLYGTFLVIPIGLTRALASQNIKFLVDDEDDEDDDDEDDVAAQQKPAATQNAPAAEEEPPAGLIKAKRRATLQLSGSGANADGSKNAGRQQQQQQERFPGARASGDYGILSTGGAGVLDMPSTQPDRQQSMYGDYTGESGAGGRLWPGLRQRIKRIFKMRSVVMPMPSQLLGSTGIAGSGPGPTLKRSLKFDSRETYIMLLPFVIWSILVIAFYASAVVRMNGMVEVVAAHSVVNFMSGRVYRAVFMAQELVSTDDSTMLPMLRQQLQVTAKKVKDAWYTLELGENAFEAAGADVEHFALVGHGISHSSPALENLFYGSGECHRKTESNCLEPDNRFYHISRTGVDSMLQHFLLDINYLASDVTAMPVGLADAHFDYVYNIGTKDLVDGILEIADAHMDTIMKLYSAILVLHIVLFLLFWVLFLGFLVFLLNPLLKRIAKERRCIAELMSQLPLELDVEKLVARALGTAATGPAGAAGAPAGGTTSVAGMVGNTTSVGGGVGGGGGFQERMLSVDERGSNGGNSDDPDGTVDARKWKDIIRASASITLANRNGSVSVHKRMLSESGKPPAIQV